MNNANKKLSFHYRNIYKLCLLFCFTATWVNRCSEDLECLDLEEEQPLAELSSMQTDKLTLFFTELLDHDRDDVICDQDFDQFFEVGRYQLYDIKATVVQFGIDINSLSLNLLSLELSTIIINQ